MLFLLLLWLSAKTSASGIQYVSDNTAEFDKNTSVLIFNIDEMKQTYEDSVTLETLVFLENVNFKIILNNAFLNSVILNSVYLSEHITYIGTSAFQNCPQLTSIVFPLSVSLGMSVFSGATRLSSIVNVPVYTNSLNDQHSFFNTPCASKLEQQNLTGFTICQCYIYNSTTTFPDNQCFGVLPTPPPTIPNFPKRIENDVKALSITNQIIVAVCVIITALSGFVIFSYLQKHDPKQLAKIENIVKRVI